jgi:putative ABC transport system permease protein
MYNDLRYAVRTLLKSPGFVLVSVLSLALGIAANTTIFSVINAVVLRPLPFQHSDRLVTVYETAPAQGQPQSWTSTANFLDWGKQNVVFERMELISEGNNPVTSSGQGKAERIGIQYVTPGLFQTLGVQTILGRAFLPEDDLEHSVVLSYSFWQRHFGADPGVVGKSLSINGAASQVVGVLAPRFRFFGGESESDAWQAIDFNNPNWINRGGRWLFAFGRLRPGVTVDQAQKSMEIIAGNLAELYPDTNKGHSVRLEPLRQTLMGDLPEVLYPLFGAVAFVLLIACTNIANLLLARISTRRTEIAIRSSLGAGRLRLVRQMFTESTLLALLGGGLGLLLSVWGIEVFVSLTPAWLANYQIVLDRRVLVFTLGVSFLTGVAFGLIPAWQASKADPNQSLKEGGRAPGGAARQRTRSTLVVSEVALALVLLIGAGLMINSLLRLQRVDPGFNPQNLLALEVYLTGPKYLEKAEKREIDMNRITPGVGRFFQEAFERIRTLPGVQAVGFADWLPMAGALNRSTTPFSIAGRPIPQPAERPSVLFVSASPNYFDTMQIPLLKGRDISERDVESAPWVVVINRAMAERYWPNQNPLGEVITLGMVKEERPREIVGVVENIRQWDVSVEARPQIFLPYLQQTEICLGSRKQGRLHKGLVIRAPALSAGLKTAVQEAVADVDKDQAVYGLRTMDEIVASSMSFHHFYVTILSTFAVVALFLAAIGIYGVIAHAVNARTHEIGVRMALGAQSEQVLRMVLKQGLRLALLGVGIGLAASWAVTRLLANFLFAITAHDPLTFALVSLVLTCVTALATYFPARRATKVDPVVALRCE